MSSERNSEIEWDGNRLSGRVTIEGVLTKVTADRSIIHRHAAGFSDALGWEINRHRAAIFESLLPYFKENAKNAAVKSGKKGPSRSKARTDRRKVV